jgi:chorismate mutase
MNLTRMAALLAAMAMPVGLPAPAHAEPPSSLYRLVDTAAQRLATADPVAASKWINGGPITDTTRADQVLDGVESDAAAHNIDQAYVRTAFENQIAATEGIEYLRFSQWKFDPVAAPTTAPNLSASRSAIDGFNKVMVDEMALQWDSLGSPGCATDLESAKQAVVNDRRLDGLYRQALSSATRSYCRTT